MELQIVECVREGEQGDWAYRFRENQHGVIIRRVPKDRLWWNHGVLVQMFDKDADAFLPSNVCGSNVYFSNLADARQVAELRGN